MALDPSHIQVSTTQQCSAAALMQRDAAIPGPEAAAQSNLTTFTGKVCPNSIAWGTNPALADPVHFNIYLLEKHNKNVTLQRTIGRGGEDERLSAVNADIP